MRNFLLAIRRASHEWALRRIWTQERQIAHLRSLLLADHRWLASDKTADALTSRYLAALAPNWYKRSHEDVAQLRSRLGLVPSGGYDPNPSAASDASIERTTGKE